MGRGHGFFGGGKWNSYGEYFRDKSRKMHQQMQESIHQQRAFLNEGAASDSSSVERSNLSAESRGSTEDRTSDQGPGGGDRVCSSSTKKAGKDFSNTGKSPVGFIPGLHTLPSSSSPCGAGVRAGYEEQPYARRVREMLLNEGAESQRCLNRSLFKNCVFYVDGDTLGMDDICFKKLLILLGGRICMLFGKGCTHVVAETVALGNQKWRQLREQGGEGRKYVVVTVKWVFQCIDRNKLLPASEFRPDDLQTRKRYAGRPIDSFYTRLSERAAKDRSPHRGRPGDNAYPRVDNGDGEVQAVTVESDESGEEEDASRPEDRGDERAPAGGEAESIPTGDADDEDQPKTHIFGVEAEDFIVSVDDGDGAEDPTGAGEEKDLFESAGSALEAAGTEEEQGEEGDQRGDGGHATPEPARKRQQAGISPWSDSSSSAPARGLSSFSASESSLPLGGASSSSETAPPSSAPSYPSAAYSTFSGLSSSPSGYPWSLTHAPAAAARSVGAPSVASFSSSASRRPPGALPPSSAASASSARIPLSAASSSSSLCSRPSPALPAETTVRMGRSDPRGEWPPRILRPQHPSFVSSFFENSRLSFIGRWRTRCMNTLASILKNERAGSTQGQVSYGPSSSRAAASSALSLEDARGAAGVLLPFALPLLCTPPAGLDVAVSAEAAAALPLPPHAASTSSPHAAFSGGVLERLFLAQQRGAGAHSVRGPDGRAANATRETGNRTAEEGSRGGEEGTQEGTADEKTEKAARHVLPEANEGGATRKKPHGGEGRGSDVAPLRWVLHVDFDAFFVAVALKKKPHLKDFPVAVAHSRGSGAGRSGASTSEVASCNYIARAQGVYKGQWLGEAKERCPGLIALPYDFDGIEEASQGLFACVLDVSRRIIPVSCDETYVQLLFSPPTRTSDSQKDQGTEGDSLEREAANRVLQICVHLRQTIFERTECWVSIGAGPNLLAAKLAGLRAKPKAAAPRTSPSSASRPSSPSSHAWSSRSSEMEADGVCVAPADGRALVAFMASLPIRKLPGVGPVLGDKIASAGSLKTCGQIVKRRLQSLRLLQTLLGKKRGATLWWMAHGFDPRHLPPFSPSALRCPSPSSASSPSFAASPHSPSVGPRPPAEPPSSHAPGGGDGDAALSLAAPECPSARRRGGDGPPGGRGGDPARRLRGAEDVSPRDPEASFSTSDAPFSSSASSPRHVFSSLSGGADEGEELAAGAAAVPSSRSLTVSVNWGVRLNEESEVVDLLRQLAGEAHKRLRTHQLMVPRLGLKIYHRRQGVPAQTVKFLGAGVCDVLAGYRYCYEPVPREVQHVFAGLSRSPSGTASSPSAASVGRGLVRDGLSSEAGKTESVGTTEEAALSGEQPWRAVQSTPDVFRELFVLWFTQIRGLCLVEDLRGFNVLLMNLRTEAEQSELEAEESARALQLRRQRQIMGQFLSHAASPSAASFRSSASPVASVRRRKARHAQIQNSDDVVVVSSQESSAATCDGDESHWRREAQGRGEAAAEVCEGAGPERGEGDFGEALEEGHQGEGTAEHAGTHDSQGGERHSDQESEGGGQAAELAVRRGPVDPKTETARTRCWEGDKAGQRADQGLGQEAADAQAVQDGEEAKSGRGGEERQESTKRMNNLQTVEDDDASGRLAVQADNSLASQEPKTVSPLRRRSALFSSPTFASPPRALSASRSAASPAIQSSASSSAPPGPSSGCALACGSEAPAASLAHEGGGAARTRMEDSARWALMPQGRGSTGNGSGGRSAGNGRAPQKKGERGRPRASESESLERFFSPALRQSTPTRQDALQTLRMPAELMQNTSSSVLTHATSRRSLSTATTPATLVLSPFSRRVSSGASELRRQGEREGSPDRSADVQGRRSPVEFGNGIFVGSRTPARSPASSDPEQRRRSGRDGQRDTKTQQRRRTEGALKQQLLLPDLLKDPRESAVCRRKRRSVLFREVISLLNDEESSERSAESDVAESPAYRPRQGDTSLALQRDNGDTSESRGEVLAPPSKADGSTPMHALDAVQTHAGDEERSSTERDARETTEERRGAETELGSDRRQCEMHTAAVAVSQAPHAGDSEDDAEACAEPEGMGAEMQGLCDDDTREGQRKRKGDEIAKSALKRRAAEGGDKTEKDAQGSDASAYWGVGQGDDVGMFLSARKETDREARTDTVVACGPENRRDDDDVTSLADHHLSPQGPVGMPLRCAATSDASSIPAGAAGSGPPFLPKPADAADASSASCLAPAAVARPPPSAQDHETREAVKRERQTRDGEADFARFRRILVRAARSLDDLWRDAGEAEGAPGAVGLPGNKLALSRLAGEVLVVGFLYAAQAASACLVVGEKVTPETRGATTRGAYLDREGLRGNEAAVADQRLQGSSTRKTDAVRPDVSLGDEGNRTSFALRPAFVSSPGVQWRAAFIRGFDRGVASCRTLFLLRLSERRFSSAYAVKFGASRLSTFLSRALSRRAGQSAALSQAAKGAVRAMELVEAELAESQREVRGGDGGADSAPGRDSGQVKAVAHNAEEQRANSGESPFFADSGLRGNALHSGQTRRAEEAGATRTRTGERRGDCVDQEDTDARLLPVGKRENAETGLEEDGGGNGSQRAKLIWELTRELLRFFAGPRKEGAVVNAHRKGGTRTEQQTARALGGEDAGGDREEAENDDLSSERAQELEALAGLLPSRVDCFFGFTRA
ncbi:hypothetical protein BESB_036030 [Besnoitia besnoiti]|uniref:BRCA1 C Terminus (BRCT) domain-containing protein n=1 Tax=Besnoitia besnoiti TaxID=94643 RepID=A0A2A9MGP1_BESBE|nr:hypothetical protein BESB_036030 [Besnoitia besnoiti]PFH37145.1 hypothetical protein BESB_036030 [Besnoitia besnoiti]